MAARILTEPRRQARLQTNQGHATRLVIEDEVGTIPGRWFDVPPPYEIRIGIRDLPEWGYAEVSSTPGGFVGFVRSFSWDAEWKRRPIPIEPLADDAANLRERGITLRVDCGPAPPAVRVAWRRGRPGDRGRLLRIAFLTWRDSRSPGRRGSEVYVAPSRTSSPGADTRSTSSPRATRVRTAATDSAMCAWRAAAGDSRCTRAPCGGSPPVGATTTRSST